MMEVTGEMISVSSAICSALGYLLIVTFRNEDFFLYRLFHLVRDFEEQDGFLRFIQDQS